jgi:predicted MPP superfamily phosphohydrolase
MAKQKLLATLLHISDLHIGSIDPNTGDATINPAVQIGLDNFPIFDGLLGHHGSALRALAEFVEELRASDEKFQILVTGDLSRNGDASELALARRYFESEIDLLPPNGDYVGLRAAGKVIAIPGNHDHWAGLPVPIGATPSNFYHYFVRPLPATRSLALGSQGHQLTLIELDSDADVRPNSIQRTYARGSFCSQLQLLHAMLEPRKDREVRVLVIHHARTWTGFSLAISHSTRYALDHFLQQHEIGVILCGHTHKAAVRRHYAGGRECWECGAGSTTQFDTVPRKWRARLRNPDSVNLEPNALMLHRIFDIDGRLEWATTTFHRSATGFTAAHAPRQFALQ